MGKVKVLKFFLIVLAGVMFISGTLVSVEAGNPLGTFCWQMTNGDTIELAINDDAPPTVQHLSAVGIWQRVQYNACAPVHGTAQQDRRTKEFYELALSYEDIVHVPFIQGHFHAVLNVAGLGGPFAYQDENLAIVMGNMVPIPCPIKCP